MATTERTTAEQQYEDQLRGSSDGAGLGAYVLHRAKPHLPPWLCAGGIGLAGLLGSTQWEGSAAAGVGLTLASVALTGVTWWAGKSTGPQRRLHSAITVAAGSAWLTGACLAGPITGPLPDLYLMGGPALALSWNIRMVLRRNVDGTTAGGTDKGLLEKVGLARAQIGATSVEPNRVTAKMALEAGEQTNDDVAKVLPRIASALDLPKSAVRYLPDADSARRGELVIVPEDMLAHVAEWQGPSNLGGSIAEPLVIGRYDDGAPLLLWLPGDPETKRNSTHLLIAGGTGSGKGETALNLMLEILSRRDVLLWVSDPKMFQDFRPLLPGLDWAAEGGPDTEVMVEAIKAVIPARTRWLGAHGYRQWIPEAAEQQTNHEHTCRPDGAPCGCAGMPFLVTWMEEAANTLRLMGDDAFTGIAQEARSAGVALIVSLQRPSYDQMSTSTRASLPSVIALGCDPRDEGFSLPEAVIDAGAHPGAWGNRRPGYCYVVSPGIPEDRYPSPARTFAVPHTAVPTMEALAGWAQGNGAAADPVTAGAARAVAGQNYPGRTAAGAAPALRPVADEEHAGAEAESFGLLVDQEDAGIDPEADLPDDEVGDDIPLWESPGHKPSPEEARGLFAAALDDFEAAGQMVVGPKDFLDWCDRHHLSRPWVSARLKDAALDGRLEPTSVTGRWRIVPTLKIA
ncbi:MULTISPECIES: plasmid transfer protein TraB [Streptomyces]|uniref:plasmid transfer protein TraB n=1 Tax=Streptomyces TaxID=1883 RepID=UPI0016796AE2|nr:MULTISPECIES: plasmid transfer protein TraB [Streptomyces]MBD3578380.1 sporulation protein SsgA [Streptomyces sp. KD18]GGT10962.1 sporulation protein SsgA [Streptomyces toxytricini]